MTEREQAVASALCIACGMNAPTTAESSISGLPIRRISTFCFDCYITMANARNANLPLEMRGMWPIDVDLVRRELPGWLARAAPDQIVRIGARLAQIALYFKQMLPPDLLSLVCPIDSDGRGS